MSRPIEIRRLGIGEAEAYREIRLAALAGARQAFSSQYEIEAAKSLESFRERLASSIVCVASLEGGVAAMAGLSPAPGDRHCRGGFVWGLYVRPEARGRGVACRLMDALLRAGSEMFDEIRLDVFADNVAAVALYEKLQFFRIGSTFRAAPDGSGRRESITMVRRPRPAV